MNNVKVYLYFIRLDKVCDNEVYKEHPLDSLIVTKPYIINHSQCLLYGYTKEEEIAVMFELTRNMKVFYKKIVKMNREEFDKFSKENIFSLISIEKNPVGNEEVIFPMTLNETSIYNENFESAEAEFESSYGLTEIARNVYKICKSKIQKYLNESNIMYSLDIIDMLESEGNMTMVSIDIDLFVFMKRYFVYTF